MSQMNQALLTIVFGLIFFSYESNSEFLVNILRSNSKSTKRNKLDSASLSNNKFGTEIPEEGSINSKNNSERSLSESVCKNDPDFSIFFDRKQRSCTRIRLHEVNRKLLCQVQSVQDACPQVCGLCCEDDSNYKFEDQNRTNRNCAWISSVDVANRRAKYCTERAKNGSKLIRNMCPVSCDFCPGPVTCIENDLFTFNFRGKTIGCRDVTANNWRRQKTCLIEQVKSNCPMSCGVCCADDPSYFFPLKWKKKDAGRFNCKWISKNEKKHSRRKAANCNRLVDGIRIGSRCPLSCDSCYSEVTIAPTMEPTSEPSPPPSELSRRNLAKQINIFDTQGRKEALRMLEENFDFTNDTKSFQSDDELRNAALANENYYADLPDFVTQDISDPFKCKCVNCEEDMACGGLWRGNRYEYTEKTNLNTRKIHIVVSHCKSPLDWMDEYVNGHDVASIHIITKCGEPLSKIDAPSMATIERLPNVGRCDHTYAYYIANVLPNIVKEEDDNDSIVFFLKDDISAKNLHQSGEWNDFEGLHRIVSSENGFACGILPNNVDFGQHQFLLSAYHEVETLLDFSMDEYQRNIKGYVEDATGFQSVYGTMGAWWRSLNFQVTSKVVQVCYGGMFAASVSNINNIDISIWNGLEKSLSRGSNIQEGHYAERSWAALLSTPLQPFQIDALLYKSDGVYVNKNSMYGALMARPRLYLHVGVFGTFSSELLTESLIENESLLKVDSYNIAVHGKYDNGIHGFPNIDRLASCMWSDMMKSTSSYQENDMTICPKNLLPKLKDYIRSSERDSQKLVLLNPWLARPGTAESLGVFIDPHWDVTTVIYYRRYFEWITIMFEHYREDFINGSYVPEMPIRAFRYIDFLRKHNKRLFDSASINDYIIRDSRFDVHEDIINVKKRQRSKEIDINDFNPSSNFDLKELTDLEEYTYFVAKQYNSVARLRKVEIVNFHDIRGAEVNFFCHVLDDAHNSCKSAVDQKDAVDGHFKMKMEEFNRKMNMTAPFELETALQDIVIAASMVGRLQEKNMNIGKRGSEQINYWIEMIRSALEKRKVAVEDLPWECLHDFETSHLLQVSLAYEQSMLPVFYASSKGEKTLRNTFSRWKFCSVDTTEILENSKWDFLFESSTNFDIPVLPSAFVHITTKFA